ncbi:hypothetical protein C3L50_08460 [Flavobacterium alvei]|uniref:Uncharacterized protein n=1 Tax=Flavobacterium alvei TaxID=2080416 RepID=A0A2S5ACL5_9FLAO|nr:hypothetical protein C3L50_08460 [Flavobacterium alvei]
MSFFIDPESLTFVLIWWLPLTIGIANLYRNIYFSLFWLLICMVWFILKEDFITSILPLTILIYLHLVRLFFRYIFKYEPVFLMVSKFSYTRYSKIERRESTKTDFIFTMLTFLFGAIISILIANF